MAQYALKAGQYSASNLPPVGDLYNVGISDGTRYYGYIFQNAGQQSAGMTEKSDVASKGALQNYGSPNLVDRDLVYYPRVSQGDFSGGMFQAVFSDPTRYYDSDLEIRNPGYLTLRPDWNRPQIVAGNTGTNQCAAYNNNIYTVFGGASMYSSNGTAFTPGGGVNPKLIDTDGNLLYLADGVNTLLSWNASTFTTISGAIGAIKQMWVVNLGTNGRFLYYTTDNVTLLKVDLSSNTIGIAVPLGSPTFFIVDISPFQNGIAIATKDFAGGGTSDVWFHDGTNLTRLARLGQYSVSGICNCLGELFVTATSQGQYEPPVLLRMTSGDLNVVARFGTPTALLTTTQIGAPVSSGQYVYFSLSSPQIGGITTTSYIGVHDLLTGSVSHLGNLDANDAPGVTQPRQLAVSGRAVTFPMAIGSNTYLQFQTNTSRLAPGNAYRPSGWLVSSRLDFATPGISKRFRRIEVVHAPLASGESIKVNAYLDSDPVAFTTSLAPSPTTATTTNSAVGSVSTVLTMGASAVGKTLYYALQLAGPGTSSPKVHYVAVEVGGTWTWEFDLDCSSRRRLLNQGAEDTQGVSGKDLAFLLRNAYENGTTLTLYLAQSVSYTVAIESLENKSAAYSNHQGQQPVKADEEWLTHVVLRQVA